MDKLLLFLSDGSDARSGYGDSFCDRVNCRYTVFVLTVFALVVTSRVQVGDPISCWCPAHFTSSHVAYTNKVRRAMGGNLACISVTQWCVFRCTSKVGILTFKIYKMQGIQELNEVVNAKPTQVR